MSAPVRRRRSAAPSPSRPDARTPPPARAGPSRGRLALQLLLVLLAACLGFGLANGAAAQPQALVSNVAKNVSGRFGLTADRAQAFTTGTNSAGYVLTGIDAVMRLSDAVQFSGVTVEIRADSGGNPGTVVGTLAKPAYAASSSDTTYAFTAPGPGLDLAANATYFVVFDVAQASAGVVWAVTSATDEDANPAAGWSIADNRHHRGQGSWNSGSTQSHKIRVNGKIKAAPQVLLSNVGQANHSTGIAADSDRAKRFTTGGNAAGYRLGSVEVEFDATHADLNGALTVSVLTSKGAAVGTPIQTLAAPTFATSNSGSVATFTSPGLNLGPSTSYWILLDMSASVDSASFQRTNSSGADAGGASGWSFSSGLRIRNFKTADNSAWFAVGHSLKMRINGVVRATDANRAPTGKPTISGVVRQGRTLTADVSGIMDADGLGAFSYQWKRGGTAIAGATSSTYVPVLADVAFAVTVEVSWVDGAGTYETVASAPTAQVRGPNAVPTASNGTVTVNEDTAYTFTAANFNFADADSGDTLSSVKVTALESAGDLELDGADVTANQ
ncbi:MAG: hypothetical protein OXG51_16800, partial [Gammaproteobacteria bacterium]|nr:hypothetical protein [Gammaproteobacteria bacterium]